MDVYPEFRALFASLNRHGVEYVIVGAYALAHYGVPRATQDIDVLVHASPEHASRVMAALDEFGFGDVGLTEQDFAQPHFVFRLGRPPAQVDLLTVIPGVSWAEVWAHRSPGQYGDVPVSYIGREQFIRNKRASGRLQDRADAERLEDDGEDE